MYSPTVVPRFYLGAECFLELRRLLRSKQRYFSCILVFQQRFVEEMRCCRGSKLRNLRRVVVIKPRSSFGATFWSRCQAVKINYGIGAN